MKRLHLSTYLNLGVIGTFICLYGGLLFFESDSLWFFGFLFLAKDFFFAQVSIALTRQNEEFFCPTEARRVVPVIDSAITIGGLIGALLVIQGLDWISQTAVLHIWGAVLLGMSYLIYRTDDIIGSMPEITQYATKEHDKIDSLFSGISKLGKIPFLRLLCVIIVLQSLIFTVIEYEFTQEIQHHVSHSKPKDEHTTKKYPLEASLIQKAEKVIHHATEKTKEIAHEVTGKAKAVTAKMFMEETLAHALGMFHLLFSGIALIVQLLIASKVLEKIGIIGSITSYHVILAISILGYAFGYGNVSMVRAIQHGFHALSEAPYHITYYSVKHQVRESIRLILEGIVKPIGIIGGFLIITYVPTQFIWPSLLCILGLLLLLHKAKNGSFTQLCYKNVQLSQKMIDKLHALETLGHKGHQEVVSILSSEIRNKREHEILRRKSIDVATKIQDPNIIHAYIRVLKDPEELIEIKIEVLKSILKIPNISQHWEGHAFSFYNFVKTLKLLLETETDRQLKKLIVMNLFQHLPVTEVVPFFVAGLESADDELKSIYLRSSRVIQDPEILDYVEPYLNDDNPKLKGHALIALWDFYDQKILTNQLVGWIGSENEEEIIGGIYAIGEVQEEQFIPMIRGYIGHKNQNIHIQALVALTKLGQKDVKSEILKVAFGPDQELANKIYHMLERVENGLKESIRADINYEVAIQVSKILEEKNIHTGSDFEHITAGVWQKLLFLYSLAGRYDCVAELDQDLAQMQTT